ncbi:MAG: hypothetical protein ABII12_03655 [Planctomycetota bacterium]
MNAVFKPAAILVVICICANTLAQNASTDPTDGSDVARALDRELGAITISEKEIPDALTEIGAQAGVKITIDDSVADLLPWGRHTKLKDVSIEHASLRQALPQILGPLGMTYEVRDGITVVASKPLERINRRATWEDLKLLRRCDETPYSDEAVANLNIQYRITSKVDAPKMLLRQLARAGRGTLAEMLETACSSLGWVWLPEGDHIVIRTYEGQIANQLSRRINARYTNMPLAKILNDLAARADVALFLEPGMMLKLPRSAAQSSTLLLDHGTIRQAFELLSAETGLEYRVTRDGISIRLSEAIAGVSSEVAAARRSPYVGKISFPSKDGTYTLDFLLRGDDLPPDILQYREQIIEEYVERMRGDLEQLLEQSIESRAETADNG